jgi:hypothetical protein
VYGTFKDSVSNIIANKTPPFRKPRIICSRSEVIKVPQFYIIKTRLRAGRSGVRIPVGASRPDRLWGPLSPLFNEYRRPFPRLKRPGSEVCHSSPSSAEIKNECSYTSIPPPGAFMAWTGKTLPFTFFK